MDSEATTVPQSGELMQIFVNCEIQNNDTPGYPIPKRGIYYALRMMPFGC